jgi:chromosome segregation ATPase
MNAASAVLEREIPDLVQTAWKTEKRIRSLEVSLSPTMNDLHEVRLDVKGIATDLTIVKIAVSSLWQDVEVLKTDVGFLKTDLNDLKTEVHAITHEQRRMNAEIETINGKLEKLDRHSVILDALVDHFGLTIPASEVAAAEA